jgi:hypothetical protein
MERAEARRLQPHYIESFFLEAFKRLGGTVRQREPRRYEVTHVPAPVRNRDRLIGTGEPVLPRYERIAFEKSLVAPRASRWPRSCARPPAARLRASTSPSSATRPAQARHVLVDERDLALSRACSSIWSIPFRTQVSPARASDASSPADALRGTADDGVTRHFQYAPYLDYRPLADGEPGLRAILLVPECAWISRDVEQKALGHAVANVVPEHWQRFAAASSRSSPRPSAR